MSEPIENETLDDGLNSAGMNTISILPQFPMTSTFLPGIDDNMASTLLRTDANISTLKFTTSTKAIGTPMDTNIAGTEPVGISQYALPSTPALSQFDFIQTLSEEITLADLSPLAHIGQQSSLTTNTTTPTTSIPANDICDMTLAQLQQQPLLVAEMLRKELNHQKIRNDNRERKKRWREQNEERNKDNDLRCRVNKRAHNLFGNEDSEQKQRWVIEEFVKRQCRRRDKERRRTVMDDAVSSVSSHSSTTRSPSILRTLKKNNLPHGPDKDEEHTLPRQLADFLHSLQQCQSSTLVELPGTMSTLATSSSPPIISAASVFPTSKSEAAISFTTSSIPPMNQSMKIAKISSPSSKPREELENISTPAIATAALSSPPVSNNTDVMVSESSAQQSSTQKNPLSAQLDPTNTLHENRETSTNQKSIAMAANSFNGARNAIISTLRKAHHQPDRSPDKALSTLLIKTLQQPGLVYQEKLGNATASSSSSPARTECHGSNKSQLLFQLYPLDAIVTLTKINTEWTNQ